MPHPSRVRSALLLAAVVGLTGCKDVVAPVANRVEAFVAKVSNLVTCDNTWTTANGGLWSDASRWSAGHVPTATENACILAEGNYTVVLIGMYSVNSLTVSTPSNNDKPKLSIQGQWSSFNFQSTISRLTAANGIDNYGWMELTSAGGPQAGSAQLVVTGGTFYNHDVSSFRSLPGTVTGRFVQGTVINDGTMAFDTPTSAQASFTNNALFTVAAAGSLSMSSGTFVQAGGSFNNDGYFFQNPGEFQINGGVMTGNAPVLMGVTLKINNQSVPGTVILRGTNTLTGDVGASQVLQVEGWQLAAGWNEVSGILTATTGFTNAGLIRLTSTGGPMNGAANLGAVTGATIVNTGRIEVLVGLGNVRSITANIDNRSTGVVDIQQNISFSPTPNSGVTTNAGMWKVAAGKRFYVQANEITFRQNGGTLDVTGAQFQHTGMSTFEMNGGTILGEPWVQGTLRIGAGSTATGRVFMTAQSQLVGDVMSGQTVTIAASDNTYGTLTAPGSFTNHGTIILTSIGTNTGSAALVVPATSTITNATDGRIEMYAGTGFTDRHINGNFVNAGTLHVTTRTFLNGPVVHSSGPITGGAELRNWNATMFATGNIQANLLNAATLHVGQSVGQAGQLNITGYFYMYGGTLNVDIGGSVPGTDFDKITASDWTGTAGTLNVATTAGGCAGGGASYEILKGASHSGDFGIKNGLNLGGGRTVTTVPGASNYVLNVSGPVCVPPDVTPPVIAPTVTGTLGNNGWYTSDVSVTWSVTDSESAVSSKTGCDAATLSSDNAGVTYTCSATSVGGTNSQSVTVKRDATAPVITKSALPAPNANGWNNTDVTATFSATDAMSGLNGVATKQGVFNAEGVAMNFGAVYTDNAGNTSSALIYASIDRTAPVVSATRSPGANANGWNNTDVTATYSATDALSGIDGSSSVSQLFSTEGENQSGSRVFTDKAGNSASATIGEISIDKTAPVATATRSPAPGPDGWNETDVTVTYSATDPLSGIDGSASATQVFGLGENQSGSRTFADRAGNTATATIGGINVRAPAPPPPPPPGAVSCSATPNSIWPPNNKMVAIKVTITGGSPILRSVTNNETGTADVEGWTIGAADLNGSVRATRLGGGNGRVYTLAYDVTHAAGVSQCLVKITVPHDQTGK